MSRLDTRIVQSAVARRGIHICVGIPALLLAIGLLLRSQFEFLSSPVTSESNLHVVGYCLISLSLVLLAAAFLLKRRVLASTRLREQVTKRPAELPEILAEALFPALVLVTIPSLLGLIFYFLGGDLDTYVLITVFCPAGLMLCKPRDEEIERMECELFGSEE
jgi:hypothetical protein